MRATVYSSVPRWDRRNVSAHIRRRRRDPPFYARPLPLDRRNVSAHIRRRWCTMFCRCRSFTRPAAENTAEVTADTTTMARKTADSTCADHRCFRVVCHHENSRKQCPWNRRMPITVAIPCGDTTGSLRPPLLCCDANVCRRKNDFCDAQTHRKNGRNVFLPKEAELRGLLWKISGILATAFLWKAALNTGTWSG